jgi:NCS1 family nucleobase:cation symporter-1
MAEYTQLSRGGLYELTDSARAQLVDSKYYNADLAPTSFKERTWNTYHISMLWVGMAICLPSFTMAQTAVNLGLPVWAAVINVILGNAIILVPIQLNSHAGTKYGIPFPVFSRLTFGMRGAQIPTISRAITASGWNMVQCLSAGGPALLFLIVAWKPDFDTSNVVVSFIAFLIFLIISGLLTAKGSRAIRIFESFSSPLLIVLSILLLVWAIVIANGAGYSFGEVFTTNISQADVGNTSAYVFIFCTALTGNIAFWATMALNIPDFSRYSKNQKAQFRGQMYGMLPGMAFCAVIGAFFAQTTTLVYNQTVFSPVDALGFIGNNSVGMHILIFVIAIGVIFATLTTNIAANVVAPANGFSNLAPRKISYKMGTLIACIVAVGYYGLFQVSGGWSGFLVTFLNVYGGFLAPLASIFILDYYFIKKRNLDIASLYLQDGRYWYKNGFNVHAVVAWIAGAILPTLITLIPAMNIGVLAWINANSYLFAFFVALIVYYFIMPREHVSNISDEEEAAMTQQIA